MKTAWFMIIFGTVLMIDGVIRIVMGIISDNVILIAGGIFTGLFLGGYLINKGNNRRNRHKTGSEGNNDALQFKSEIEAE